METNYTYDIYFNDENNANNKGFAMSFDDAMNYIESYNGTDESYFKDYKHGIVSIVCNETGEELYSESIKQKAMKVTAAEKAFYDRFIELGIDSKSLIHFISNVRKCPMYGSIFHIAGLDGSLKTLLSKIYHYKVDIKINGKDARSFISETWCL